MFVESPIEAELELAVAVLQVSSELCFVVTR
jgi:hypothetical protein